MKRVMGVISIAVALVMASLIGVPTAQATVTATTIAVSAGDNQAAPPGTAVSTAPAVIVTGAGSVPVAGVSVTFTIASGGGSLASPGSPATVTTGSDGIATAPAWTLGATVGSNTLTATAASLAGSPVTFTATGTTCAPGGLGTGSLSDPFQIADQTQLAQLALDSNCRASGLHFKQTADITLSGDWTPIGINQSYPFRGTYDGNSKTISGLSVPSTSLCCRGLFGYTTDATLTNIRLIGASVSGTGSQIGGIVGQAGNTDILNSSVTGTIAGNGGASGAAYVGGVAGYIAGGSLIQNTTSAATVTGGGNNVGGIVGSAAFSELISVTFSGNVTVVRDSTYTGNLYPGYTGGIVGEARQISIHDASSTGAVTGFIYVGGIVGYLATTTATSLQVTGSTSSGTVTGRSSVGGLVGHARTEGTGSITISGSRADGSVSGVSGGVGGLLGSGDTIGTYPTGGGSIIISGSRANGSVSGQEDVGGLAGELDARTSATATIEDSYATGSVTATYAGTSNTGSQAGGLAGTLLGNTTVRRSYAAGGVTAWRYLGGLVGEAEGTTSPATSVTITDSFATGALTLTRISVAPPGDTVTPGYAGALVGDASTSTIQNSYAVGWIGTLNPAVGGVMGATYAGNTISGVQWNTQTTGTSYAGYSPAYPGPMSGTTGLTTSQMRSSTNFPGWDFSTVWGYDCSTSIYPQLRSINSSATATSCPEPPPSTGGGSSITDPTPTPTPTSTPAATSEPAPTAPDLGNPRRVTGSQLAAIPPSQIGLIPAADFGRIPAAAFAALTPQQVAALTPGQVNAIRPGRAAALTPAAVAAMSPGQLASLRLRSVGALKPAALAALSGEQLSALRPAAIASIPPDVLARLSVEQLRALTPAQVRAMTPEQRAALSPRQRSALS